MAVGLFFGLSSIAFSQGAPPKPIETNWPGITATVHQIVRLPANQVAVNFLFRAAANAPEKTYIADRPIQRFANTAENEPPNIPYNIQRQGILIDEATGKNYPSARRQGEIAASEGGVLMVMRPGDAFYIGGIFECPPVNQDDPPKDQRISFRLPGLKEPVRKVLLPREVDVPLNFFPPPKMLHRREKEKEAPSGSGT